MEGCGAGRCLYFKENLAGDAVEAPSPGDLVQQLRACAMLPELEESGLVVYENLSAMTGCPPPPRVWKEGRKEGQTTTITAPKAEVGGKCLLLHVAYSAYGGTHKE